jgi:hypothetical protein
MAGKEVVVSEPKTLEGRRAIALDDRTVEGLRAWGARQAQERQFVGPGYIESGMVFTQPDGSAIKPYLFTIGSRRTAGGRVFRGFGCTTFGTVTPALPWRPGCRRRF